MSLNDRVVKVIDDIEGIEAGKDGVLDLDELQELLLVMALEDEFGVKIPDADHKFRTVEDIVEYLSPQTGH
jgi:acyl carrier protein